MELYVLEDPLTLESEVTAEGEGPLAGDDRDEVRDTKVAPE